MNAPGLDFYILQDPSKKYALFTQDRVRRGLKNP